MNKTLRWKVCLLAGVTIALLVVGLTPNRLQGQQTNELFQEVALISTSVKTEVLCDLLTVALTDKDFSLIGRQELLTALANERALDSLVAQSGAGERTRIGQLIRADVMVILRHTANEAGARVDVVFAETRSGTRIGKLSFRDDDAVVLVPLITKQVVRLRDRLSNGIQQIVAIPPFVSNDLSHDLDDLQTTISNYLTETLAETPGFVVVEFEEANSILAENSLHPDEVDRKIPVIVNGQFTTQKQKPGKLAVAVTLDLGDEKIEISESIEYTPESPEALSDWLRNTLASRIASIAEQKIPGITAAAQIKNFTERADEFASLGDVDNATSLREAVLVLEPRNATQRKQLVREYATHANHQWSTSRHLRHFEYLARNKMLSDRLQVRRFFISRIWESRRLTRERIAIPENQLLDEVRFCVVSAKAWNSLPNGKSSRRDIGVFQIASGKAFPWWNLAANRIWRNFARAPSAEMLQLQADFLEQYPSDELPCGGLAVACIQGAYGDLNLNIDQVDRNDWDKYFERLDRSANQTARYAGNLSRTYYLLWHARAVTRVVPRSQLKEFQGGPIKLSVTDSRLLRDSVEYCIEQLPNIRRLEKSDQGKRWEGWSLYRRRENYTTNWLGQINRLFAGVDHYFPAEKYASKVKVEGDPLNIYTKPAPRKAIDSSFERLEFTPIELKVKGTLPKLERRFGEAGLRGLVQCGDFDVLWTQDRVFLMKQPGVLEPLNVPNWYAYELRLARVSWDGRYVWLSSGSNSLFILDSQDWSLHEVSDLPEKDQIGNANHNGIATHCYEEGRAIAVGSFGKHHRVWCAEVKVQDSGSEFSTTIDVFHTAKTVADYDNPHTKTDPFNPNLAFIVRAISLVETGDGGKRMLINGRGYPLMIDPDTKNVSVLKHRTFNASQSHVLAINGDLFIGKNLYRSFDTDDVEEINLDTRGGTSLVHHEGWIYIFGGNYTWDRINVETLAVEPLATMVPHPHRSNHCAVSTHHGLVAFARRNSDATGYSNAEMQVAIPSLYQMTIKNKLDDK